MSYKQLKNISFRNIEKLFLRVLPISSKTIYDKIKIFEDAKYYVGGEVIFTIISAYLTAS